MLTSEKDVSLCSAHVEKGKKVEFEEESVKGLVFGSCVLFVLLLALFLGTTGKAEPDFLTGTEQSLIDHMEYEGKLFVEAEQFSQYRDLNPETTFEPGMGDVILVANRGQAQAYLVPHDVLYVIQNQTFDPRSLAEKGRK